MLVGQPLKNRLISAARSARYTLTEPFMLANARWENDASNPKWRRDTAPLVSIYIPTFNRCDLLMERAIPSVLAQSYKNWELTVCAHGCTDGTIEAVMELADRDPRVRLFTIPRTQTYPPTAENHWLVGPVVPTNVGLEEARGDWIARLDDDDEWLPNSLRTMLRFAQERGVEFASALTITPDGIPKPYLVMGQKVGPIQTWIYRSYLKLFRFNPECWRKSWNRVNDTDVQDRMVRAGVRMAHLPRVVCRVMPRTGESLLGSKVYLSDPELTEQRFAF